METKMPPLRNTNPRESTQQRASNWKKTLRGTWESYRWLIIGGCWLVALALGYFGFAQQARQVGETLSPPTLLYLTLQLISMNSGAVPEPVTWSLNIARFLIPLLTAFTAFQAFALIFQEQLNRFRLGRIHQHIVIAGLSHKGFALVKSFRGQGERVVVIERNEANDLLEPCRAHGAMVILGDATDAHTLARAAVPKAKALIAVCDDSTNAEIAVQARGLLQECPEGNLTCILHIVDPQLYDLLREQEIDAECAGSFRLELFNVYERGAQALIKELPVLMDAGSTTSSAPCLGVIGLGQLGHSLVIQAARTWWERAAAWRSPDPPLRILAIDLQAKRKSEALHARFPRLAQACELIPVEMDVRSPGFQRGEFLPPGVELSQVDIFYVCMDDDNLSLYTSLSLQRLGSAPVVVRVTERTGLANLINQRMQAARRQDAQWPEDQPSLRAFILLEQTCTPELLIGGTHEILARETHAEYLRSQLAAGKALYSKDSLAPWDELSEEIKESNRKQVDRIGEKLKAINCRLAPLTDWDASVFKFSSLEVERMAQMEHDAWVAQLKRDGWRFAEGSKDPLARTHPDLVAWSELPEAEKEKNRIPVRELPRFLARAGFQIERIR